MKVLKDFSRFDIVNFLNGNQNLGVELGVAEGIFSSAMIESGKFKQYIGIDMYADGIHNTDQYKRALHKYGLNDLHKLLRMRFEDAIDLFPDESLDFIYVDGYAHNGEEGGKTIFDWHKKLKVGGIMSGDDYHTDWPLVKEAVDNYLKATNSELMITQITSNKDYCRYPTWGIIKLNSNPLAIPITNRTTPILVKLANLKFLLRKKISVIIPKPIKKLLKNK